MFGVVLISVIFITSLVIYIVICHKRKTYTKFVLNNSVALQKIKDINNEYKFNDLPQVIFYNNTYDNKDFYDLISCEDYLIYNFQDEQYELQKVIKQQEYNVNAYKKYMHEIDKINEFGKFAEDTNKLKISELIKVEKTIFKEKILNPMRNFSVKVTLYCSLMNGVVYHKKSSIFTPEEIKELIQRLNNKNRGYYNDKEIWDAICLVERGKVSNKMRFAIYERDGYRCCNCGRSDNESNLEIDHIRPISKGGKSTYNNLQTLCSTCNKNKGNRY